MQRFVTPYVRGVAGLFNIYFWAMPNRGEVAFTQGERYFLGDVPNWRGEIAVGEKMAKKPKAQGYES